MRFLWFFEIYRLTATHISTKLGTMIALRITKIKNGQNRKMTPKFSGWSKKFCIGKFFWKNSEIDDWWLLFFLMSNFGNGSLLSMVDVFCYMVLFLFWCKLWFRSNTLNCSKKEKDFAHLPFWKIISVAKIFYELVSEKLQ